jgi:hypothetical protein
MALFKTSRKTGKPYPVRRGQVPIYFRDDFEETQVPVAYVRRKSPIAGYGEFATRDLHVGEMLEDQVPSAGFNHSKNPNVAVTTKGYDIVIRPVKAGEELLSDYGEDSKELKG